jgi:hypothetical protein
MYFYNILPTKNLGNNLSVLSYSSQIPLEIGNIVEIDIRNKADFGLVISENKELAQKSKRVGELSSKNVSETALESGFLDVESEILNKIKPISRVIPFKLENRHLQFIKLFADNTFNSLNDVWDSCWKPFELLTKKQFEELEINFASPQKSTNLEVDSKPNPKIEFELYSDYLIRIIYIIRNIIGGLDTTQKALSNQQNKTILVIFPEIKLLNKIYDQFEKSLKNQSSDLAKLVDLKIYSGAINKNSKQTIWSLVQTEKKNEFPRLQIIFSTRAGIFLSFKSLTHIILVDESNSMYIQDQNSLYYDTREAIFLLSKAFLSNLTFISRVPSVRLYNFYPEKVLEYNLNSYSENKQNSPKIKITKYDRKSAKFELFGWEIEQLLRKDEDLES